MTKNEHYEKVRQQGLKRIALAKQEKEQNPCAKTREAYRKIWQEVNDELYSISPPKRSGFGSRAGRRQQAERRAK